MTGKNHIEHNRSAFWLQSDRTTLWRDVLNLAAEPMILAHDKRGRIMRYELTDNEWSAIKPMLPNKPRGVPRVNDRRVLNGIFWVLRALSPSCQSGSRQKKPVVGKTIRRDDLIHQLIVRRPAHARWFVRVLVVGPIAAKATA
jgi:transposase